VYLNEYDRLRWVALRDPEAAYKDDLRIDSQWQSLRFHQRPDFSAARAEHAAFRQILIDQGVRVVMLADGEDLTLDSIYTRDALLVSTRGLILCAMGRPSRRQEPALNSKQMQALDTTAFSIAGEIMSPGTIEGGDLIWIDEHRLAVGLGPRTNQAGINQLQHIVGASVEVHVVPLPSPDHPEDVFHLMSMISPLDSDLALIYRPLMPATFLAWLGDLGIQYVDVPEEEFLAMGCNVLAMAPRQVLMLDRLPMTRARLEAAGCHVTVYQGDHISRMGEGGPTCLTRPLVRGGDLARL
jgi:N-dimethylarginine dimethylaminohydrolase